MPRDDVSAAERMRDLDATDPYCSWDALVARGATTAAGDTGRPGDRYPMDADLDLYWPYVRAEWEEGEPKGR